MIYHFYLITNLHDKTKYVIHIKSLKAVLNYGLVLKTFHWVIKFNQIAWIELYIVLNTNVRKKGKNDFEKYFLKLMNRSVFGKTMKNVRKYRDINLVTTEKRTM